MSESSSIQTLASPGGMVLIERGGDDVLRVFAKPASLTPLIVVAILGSLLITFSTLYAVSSIARLWGRGRDASIEIAVLVVLAAMAVIIVRTLLVAYRNLRSRRGVVIELGDVMVFTPEQVKRIHVFPRSTLRAAELAGSRQGESDLLLRVHEGSGVRALVGYPASELAPAAAAINAMIVQTRHNAFEVLAARAAPSRSPPPIPAIPVESLPVESPPVGSIPEAGPSPMPAPPLPVLPIEPTRAPRELPRNS